MNYEEMVKKAVALQEGYPIEITNCRIKLDANESPFQPSESFRDKVAEIARGLSLNRYPEPGSPGLKRRFARYLGVPENMVLTGNGSDELIQVLASALEIVPERGVMVPVPTFAIYGIVCRNNGHRVTEIPLDEGFNLDREAMLEALSRNRPQVVFMASPNNPTGNRFDPTVIEDMLRAMAGEGIVVVDEAYVDYADSSFLPRIGEFENLVILRTLSKNGMAGLRTGVLVGQPSLIRQLRKVCLPYNINLFSQEVASYFLENEQREIIGRAERIKRERRRLTEEMAALEGIEPFPSEANFVLFRCIREKNNIYNYFLEKGILIKNFTSPGPLSDCMRVTVGTEEENSAFIDALKEAVLRQGA